MFSVSAICAPQNELRVEADFQEEMRRALDGGFAADEVAEAQKGYLQVLRMRRTEDSNLAAWLTEYLYTGRTYAWDEAFEEKVARLTPSEVSAAVRRHFDPARMMIVKAGDFAHAKGAPAAPASGGVAPR